MARLHLPVVVGFVVPLILILVNLVLGYGGLLVFILLVIWLGLAVFLITPEDPGTS
jgi:hypothetical protein